MAQHKLSQYALSAKFPDVSAAKIVFVPVPFSGRLILVQSALEGAITVDDATITVDAGATEVGDLVVGYDGSAAGDVDSLVCDDVVSVGDTIKLDNDGGSTDAASLGITMIIDRFGN